MSELRFFISMSLDGYVAGPNQSAEDPLGVGGEQLHEWIFPLAAWRKDHGEEGGEENASTPVIERRTANNRGRGDGAQHVRWRPGAVGRGFLEGIGESPPFHVPVFLGDGERLFENLGPEPPELELVDVVDGPGATHLRYRSGN
jgi:hypothetical protein